MHPLVHVHVVKWFTLFTQWWQEHLVIHWVSLHLRRLIWSTQVISHNSPRRLEHCCTTNPRPSMTQPHHTGADGVALATRRISRQVQSVPTDAHGTHWPVRIWTYEYCDATPTLVSNQAAHNGSPSLVTIPSSASMVSPLPNLKHGTLCPSPSTTSPTLYILKEHWKLVILTEHFHPRGFYNTLVSWTF